MKINITFSEGKMQVNTTELYTRTTSKLSDKLHVDHIIHIQDLNVIERRIFYSR